MQIFKLHLRTNRFYAAIAKSFSTIKNKGGSYYGFSCSLYSDPELEDITLEKSIRQGTRLFIGQSSRLEAYDSLCDILASEEIPVNDFIIGHKFTSIRDIDKCTKEIESVHSSLRSKSLDFITIPWELSTNPTATDNNNQINLTNIQSIKNIITQNPHPKNNEIKIGFDFSTETLLAMTPIHISNTLSQLTSLHMSHSIGILSLATNSFTAPNASQLIAWSNESKCISMATDTLRAHSTRPGSLCSTIKGFSPPKIQDSVNQLQKSLDHCIHIEKQYLEKLKDATVDSRKVCWAHILASTQDTILFPEEWAYIRRTQIEPKWVDGKDKLSKVSKAHSEWVQLHTPLVRHLFSTFENVLQARKESLLDTVIVSLSGNQDQSDINNCRGSGSSSKSSSPEQILKQDIPSVIAAHIASLNSTHVVLSGTEVAATRWQAEHSNQRNVSDVAVEVAVADSLSAMDSIRKCLVEFGKDSTR
eukprot:gene11222-23461_t